VGADGAGIRALEQLRAEGIDTSGVAEVANEATGAALIVVDADGENQIAVGAGANAALTPERVRSVLAERLAGCGCVLVSTEVADAAAIAAVRAALDAGVPCVLNPAPVTPAARQLLDSGALLTPNRGELTALLGDTDAKPVEAQAAEFARRAGTTVIATLGADGALIATAGSRPQPVPAGAVEARDTTGAGDAFNGVLAARLAGGAPLAEAVRWAVAAASLSVEAAGAREGMPDASAIRAAVARVVP
jgi:ribokinase